MNFIRFALLIATASGIAGAAWGQAYPAKPIKLVAPSTPGDAPDVIARLIADKLSGQLGQPVLVE
ncbi:MAG: ABC transporter substrate-binding protein, partial [Lautropia sp.]|nr:ABC transporter substrate-binding protein [Lautropia sp.]